MEAFDDLVQNALEVEADEAGRDEVISEEEEEKQEDEMIRDGNFKRTVIVNNGEKL